MNFHYLFAAGLAVYSTNLLAEEQPSRSNILFIMSDDLNTCIGPYMNISEHTPNLDRLAREGVTFSRAYCQYPVSGPSRASIMSGLYPETNGTLNNADVYGNYRKQNPALSNHPSMAGFFREHGYFTARVSKIFHMGVPGGIENGAAGSDDPDSWDYTYNVMGPETLSDGKLDLLSPQHHHYGGSFARMILPNHLDYSQTDYMAASQAIAILENRAGEIAPNATNLKKPKAEAPFFLAVGFVRPHVPFVAPQRCYEPYSVDSVKLPNAHVAADVPSEALRLQNERGFRMNELQQKETIASYMASVRFMDEQVGRLLDALDRLELRDNTIVVFMSDHGYNLGEHNCWAKQSLWEGSVRAPLIISSPKHAKSNSSSATNITEFIDVYPTLADLCDYSDKAPSILQGKSLVSYIENPKLKDDSQAYTVSYAGRAKTLRTNKYRYTCWGEIGDVSKEELYDHSTDPEEHYNRVDDKNYQKELENLRKEMRTREYRVYGKQ